jgi:hypothetical protein
MSGSTDETVLYHHLSNGDACGEGHILLLPWPAIYLAKNHCGV